MDSHLKLLLNGDPGEVLMLLIRLRNPDVAVPYCKVICRFGDIITCRLQRCYLLQVYNSPDVFSVKAPRLIPASAQPQKTTAPRTNRPSRNLGLPYTGKGVYFATVDWGFDFAHANLRHPDGSTRFACIWDQNGTYDGNKYGYGRFYLQGQINEALQTDTPYETLGYHPGSSDLMGSGMHGTHVMDIATGTPAIGEGGVAPGATYIAVQLGTNFVNGSDLALGDSVRLIEALDFIRTAAYGAPCVINMSLGSHGDSHTGRSLVELAFDHFIGHNPGFALVQSVGNYYSAHCHIQHTLKQDESYRIEWQLPRRHFPCEVEIWYPSSDRFSVDLIDPNGVTIIHAEPFKDFQVSHRGDTVGYIFHRAHEPNTGLNHIDIILDGTVTKGRWIIQVNGQLVKDGSFNAYCERSDVSQSKFSPHQSSGYTTTGSICNGRHTITVGAYDHNNPERPVVRFSSSGPTAFGQPKPDLLAPGYRISAARSAPPSSPMATNGLTEKSGSSMAAPHVAGSLALLFEKCGPRRLTIHEVKDLLFRSLDPLPAAFVPADQTRAGNGFLNIQKLLDMVRPTTEQAAEAIDTRNENGGPFDTYRHFHPRYPFHYDPYDTGYTPIALPGRRLATDLQPGDVVLQRVVLSGRTIRSVVSDPQLCSPDVLNKAAARKPGRYVRVGQSDDYIRIAGSNGRTPSNVVVLRPGAAPFFDEAYVDPADPRIDVRAKFALQRMLAQGGLSATDADGMIAAVNSGQLAGIYGDDTYKSVEVARQLGTQRWLLVPPGRDAEIIHVPTGAPSLIFRDGIDHTPGRLDAALRAAWNAWALPQPQWPMLRRGSRGERVRFLQGSLNGYRDRHLGFASGYTQPLFNPLNPDGIFGALTQQAVQAFQQNEGLIPNGIMDIDSWLKLIADTTVCAPTATAVSWTPIHADERTLKGNTFEFNDLSIYIPPKAAENKEINKIVVFFTANSAQGSTRGNDVITHGLRGAADSSDWILIGLPSPGDKPVKPDFRVIKTQEIKDCLKAVCRSETITGLRLAAHSRGHRGLTRTILGNDNPDPSIPLEKAAINTPFIDINLLDKVVVYDAFFDSAKRAFAAQKVPASRITVFKVTDGIGANPGSPFIDLTGNVSKIAGIGGIRFIQGASLTNAAVPAALLAKPSIAPQLLLLPQARGTFSTLKPLPAGKQDFAAFIKGVQQPNTAELLTFLNDNDLLRFRPFRFGNLIGAHHFFVSEFTHELFS